MVSTRRVRTYSKCSVCQGTLLTLNSEVLRTELALLPDFFAIQYSLLLSADHLLPTQLGLCAAWCLLLGGWSMCSRIWWKPRAVDAQDKFPSFHLSSHLLS